MTRSPALRRATVLAAALLTACEPGPAPETLVDDVQVIAAVAEPLAVAPGEPWTLTTTVADPKARGAELLVWSCLDAENCATARAVPDGDQAALDLVSAAPVPLWILACDPGLCELDDPDPADLLHPFSWMQRLPLEGVSLATRQVLLTEDPVEERPLNPVAEQAPDPAVPATVAARDTKRFKFQVPGAETAYGYATAGGFEMPSSDIDSEGNVTLTWYAPKDAGDVQLWVVFEDGVGGTTVWRGSATVE